MVIYNQIKTDIGKILRKLCEQKGIEIIEAEAIRNQLQDDIANDQLSLFESVDPFTGKKNSKK